MAESERVPEDLKKLLEDRIVETVYFGDGNAIDSWIIDFSKEHPFFDNVKKLENALKNYEKKHGLTKEGHTVVIMDNPYEGEKRYMLYEKIGSELHAMGPLKLVPKEN